VQALVGALKCPQGHGFVAAARVKLAGKVTGPLARLVAATWPSMGWRDTSRRWVPEYLILSRNSTPCPATVILRERGHCPLRANAP